MLFPLFRKKRKRDLKVPVRLSSEEKKKIKKGDEKNEEMIIKNKLLKTLIHFYMKTAARFARRFFCAFP